MSGSDQGPSAHRAYQHPIFSLTATLCALTWLAHLSAATGPLLSLCVALSPLITLAWALTLSLLAIKRRWRAHAAHALLSLLVSSLLLWSPTWLLRSEVPLEASLSDSPQLRVSTWNVARLGELARVNRRQRQQERLACVSEALREAHAEVFAFQELSHQRLKALESSLTLSCHHVDYHGVGGERRGGLATCVKRSSPWRVSRARDFALGGDWRALFVELYEERSTSAPTAKRRFNVLNVHFKPHKVAPHHIKEAMQELSEGSPEALLALLSEVASTISRQEGQLEDLLQALKTLQDPTLIVGDFNAPPHTSLHKAFRELSEGAWVDAWREVGVRRRGAAHLAVALRAVGLKVEGGLEGALVDDVCAPLEVREGRVQLTGEPGVGWVDEARRFGERGEVLL